MWTLSATKHYLVITKRTSNLLDILIRHQYSSSNEIGPRRYQLSVKRSEVSHWKCIPVRVFLACLASSLMKTAFQCSWKLRVFSTISPKLKKSSTMKGPKSSLWVSSYLKQRLALSTLTFFNTSGVFYNLNAIFEFPQQGDRKYP